jgi:hypothetical protein
MCSSAQAALVSAGLRCRSGVLRKKFQVEHRIVCHDGELLSGHGERGPTFAILECFP